MRLAIVRLARARASTLAWAAGGAALAVLALWLLFSNAGDAARKDPRAIVVAPRPLTSRLALVGRIEPGEKITLVAPFDGTVKRKAVHEGQQVARGETLLVMDTADIEVQLREAQAAWLKATRISRDLASWGSSAEVAQARRRLSTARLGLNETTRRVEETRRLFERGIVPKQELDTYVQQQELQKLDVAAAEAELAAALDRGNAENREIARLELANAESKYLALKALMTRNTVVAPTAGVVVAVESGSGSATGAQPSVQEGAHVARGQALLGVASLETLTVATTVDEVDVNRLQVGQKVEITGDAFQSAHLIGTIASLSAQSLPAASDAEARFGLIAKIATPTEEQRRRIRIGMTAGLSIVLYENANAIVLPPSAIREEGGESYVLEAGQDASKPVRVAVTLGVATADGVEVRSGLKPGARVLVE